MIFPVLHVHDLGRTQHPQYIGTSLTRNCNPMTLQQACAWAFTMVLWEVQFPVSEEPRYNEQSSVGVARYHQLAGGEGRSG